MLYYELIEIFKIKYAIKILKFVIFKKIKKFYKNTIKKHNKI